MIYKPKKGQIKDDCMVYENGKYYLFSMYHKENSDKYNNVWLAISNDGVHFEDYGCIVEDFPDFIWAMKVYRTDNGFYMNSGSFTQNGEQAVLKFWKSYDLLHWEYKPELDITAPNQNEKGARLDCMNVVRYMDKYYGYATGQYGYLTSDDGAHWSINKSNIDYSPFPEYNTALGGFEVADCIEIDGTFYLFCGGFGHLGMNGYGVYVYSSKTPNGPFTPCLPYYRINGTSVRWVNMWERFFKKDGEYLAQNYMYNGYTYDCGDIYLPPIKRLVKTDKGLHLEWWQGNDVLIGNLKAEIPCLTSESPCHGVFTATPNECNLSNELLNVGAHSFVANFKLKLEQNTFTEYSSGGIYLEHSENEGSAIIFDTYGKCEIAHIKDGKITEIEDTIGFGSTAPYYLDGGKEYFVRILSNKGMFEIYVDGQYLQTFNNAHARGEIAKPITKIGSISRRKRCTLSSVRLYEMTL